MIRLRKEILYKSYIRKLDKVSNIGLSTLYILDY